MTLTDEEFRERFKPLHFPSQYHVGDTEQDKTIFALAQLGEGTAADVVEELRKLEPNTLDARSVETVKQLLTHIYDMGLVGGTDRKGIRYYNLAKITQANDGTVNPGLLAPGLD